MAFAIENGAGNAELRTQKGLSLKPLNLLFPAEGEAALGKFDEEVASGACGEVAVDGGLLVEGFLFIGGGDADAYLVLAGCNRAVGFVLAATGEAQRAILGFERAIDDFLAIDEDLQGGVAETEIALDLERGGGSEKRHGRRRAGGVSGRCVRLVGRGCWVPRSAAGRSLRLSRSSGCRRGEGSGGAAVFRPEICEQNQRNRGGAGHKQSDAQLAPQRCRAGAVGDDGNGRPGWDGPDRPWW